MEGRRIVAPPCPRSTAHLQRSPARRVESFRSWSSHLFHGRLGGRRHVRSGGRLSDTFTWSWRAMFASVSSWRRAMYLNTEVHQQNRRLGSEVRPVHCSTSSFWTLLYRRILSSCLWRGNMATLKLSVQNQLRLFRHLALHLTPTQPICYAINTVGYKVMLTSFNMSFNHMWLHVLSVTRACLCLYIVE